MITKPEVLEEDFTPSELEHRDGEVAHLKNILRPILGGYPVTGTFIYGASGTGKTCTSKHLAERLESEADANIDAPDVRTVHIDCWGDGYSSIARRLLSGYDKTIVHHQNTPKHELASLLKTEIDTPFVVTLDEADQLESDRILYELHEHPSITMLLVANDYNEFYTHLEPRVESRLTTYESIQFLKYGTHEIVGILSDRVRMAGVEKNALGGPDARVDRFSEIADVADNDARIAIGTLKNALRAAERSASDVVTRDHILEVVDETKSELLAVTYSKLTADQRVLYQILVDGGEQSIGEIQSTYRERVDDPSARRTLTRHLKKMAHYDLVGFDGENSARRYWAATDELYPETA